MAMMSGWWFCASCGSAPSATGADAEAAEAIDAIEVVRAGGGVVPEDVSGDLKAAAGGAGEAKLSTKAAWASVASTSVSSSPTMTEEEASGAALPSSGSSNTMSSEDGLTSNLNLSDADEDSAPPNYELELAASERQALAKFRAALGEKGLDEVRGILVPGESLDSCLVRFLKMNSFKPAGAVKMLRAHLVWREAERPAELAKLSGGEICGCPDELLDKYMPTWHQGFDKKGRPVVFSHYGKFRFKPILDAGVTVEKILQLHIRNSEQTARLCGQQSRKLGRNISTALIIMDTEGWDSGNLRKAALDWVKGLAKIDQEHYVERTGQLMIINAPPAVSYFIRAISWLLPQKARDQVLVYGGREQWEPALLGLIDANQLPPVYGGCGPALTIGQ